MRAKSFWIATALFAAAAAPAAFAASDAAKATMLIAHVEVLSQQMAGASNDAASGNFDAFGRLRKIRDAAAEHMARLHALADRVAPKENFADLDAAWAQLSADVGKVVEAQEKAAAMTTAAADSNAALPVLNSRFEEVVKILVEHADSTSQVMVASRQMLLADRMLRRIQFVVAGGEESQSAADGLQRDVRFYGAVLQGLISGNADLNLKPIGNPSVREILKDVETQWTALAPTLDKLVAAAGDVQDTRQAAENTANDVVALLSKADALMSRINGE